VARELTVVVDGDVCAASQLCFEVVPEAFRLNDDGVAEVDDLSAATEDQLLEAARRCPTGAIIVRDSATGERVY
jgi:ferredoxin